MLVRSAQLLVPVMLLTIPASAHGQHSAFSTGPESASNMTPTEIKAHNEKLTSKDASYVRCRKDVQIGSLMKKLRVCKTNAEWATSFKNGNQNARDTQDAMSR